MLGVLALLLLLAGPILPPLYTNRAFICENTGSRRGYRDWCFGAKTQQWYAESALETFMRAKFAKELNHRWTSYQGTGYNVFGFPFIYGHGFPGPIIQAGKTTLDPYVARLPDAEKKRLYDLFAHGEATMVESKVEEIFKVLIEDSH